MQITTYRYIKIFSSVFPKTLKILFICLYCLIFSSLTFGQIKFERLAAVKDLSSKHINDIVQDNRGFLIIATNNGLYKFDGYTMSRFKDDPSDSTALNELVFTKVFKDSNGDVWVCGRELYYYDQYREHFIKSDLNLKKTIYVIIEYNKEKLIVISSDKIGIFNTKIRKYTELNIPDSLKNFTNCHAFLDKEKNLWISDWNGKIHKIIFGGKSNVKVNNTVSYSLQKKATCIYQTKNDKILAGTIDGNILEYDKKKDSFGETSEKKLRNITQNKINNIYEDRSGTIWIVCKDGLYTYNKRLQQINFFSENVNDPHALISSKIKCLYEDKYGVLWIGAANGICTINPNARKISYLYKKSEESDGLPSNIIYSICRDNMKYLWIATDNGIVSVKPKTKEMSRYLFDLEDRKSKQFLFHTSLNNLIAHNNFLLTAGAGLNKVDFRQDIYQLAIPIPGIDTSLPGYIVRKVVKGYDSGTFLVSTSGGIAKFKINNDISRGTSMMKEGFHRYVFDKEHPEIINSYKVWDLYEDSDYKLWIGADRGLYSFDPDRKELIKYPLIIDSKKIQKYIVSCIYKSSDGNLWIGSERYGLNKLIADSGYVKKIKIFPRDVVWGILEDSLQNLWVSTCKGLIKYNYNTESIRIYDEADGLLNEEFVRNSFYKDQEGKMYFGSIGGLISFYPQELQCNKVAPDVWINDLYIFNKLVHENEEINGRVVLTAPLVSSKNIHLSYKDKVVSFGFSVIHMQSPANNLFAYYLEGFDIDWTYTSPDIRKVNYTNLPAGNYKFRVKAANADGIWSKEKVLHVTVHPPFWKTWWFKILIAIFILTGMLLFYYIRISSIKARNKLLEKLVAERTSEVELQKEELAAHAENMEEINILLKERNEEVICQAEELSQLNATKDKFFNIISHDLKNPFQAITGLSDVLLKDLVKLKKSKVKEFISMIKESSASASNLLQNLLQWSRNQTNSIDFNPSLFDLHELVDNNFTLLMLNAKEKNILLENKIAHKSYVFADKDMMQTVIRNLVNNAIKYTSNSGKISISSEYINKNIIISVKDTGVGMSKELCSKLFRIDNHVSIPGTMGETGTGLGLVICKDFVLKNNGDISVESQPGQGSTFIIQLPLPSKDLVPEEEVLEQKTKDQTEKIDTSIIIDDILPGEDEDKPLLLAIDDDEKIRISILNFFARKYQVIASPDGKNGFEQAISECPDIIISDINMPEIDGFDLCKKLKTDERTSHIPVILLTSNVGEIPTIKGYETGADDYITKPFNLKILDARVRNLLDSRKKLRELFSAQLPQKIKASGISKLDKQFLERINGIVNENISNSNLNANMLADNIAMTPRTLYRKIKALTNFTVHEYIKIIRLKKAMELLQESTDKVSDIAFMVGFNDRNYFRLSFKKLYGKNPSDFRT